MTSVLVDVELLGVSYTLIFQAVFRLPSCDDQYRAPNTFSHWSCSPLLPSFFTFLTHSFGKNVPHSSGKSPCINSSMPYPIICGAKTKKISNSRAQKLSVVGKS
jgi:olfactory receptor